MLKILIIHLLFITQQIPETFTGVEYINGTDSLKVTLRINYDLFLRDYQQTIFDDLDLVVLRSFNPFPSDLANHYLNSKLKIIVDGKEVIGKLQKTEMDDRDIRFKIFYRVNRNLKKFTVKNTILTGLSSRVENLVIIKDRYTESTVKFNPDHTEETFIVKGKSSK